MKKSEMTSLNRVFKALGHEEPDRVPLFLMLTTHGARELKIPLKNYYENPENVAEAQLHMYKKYENDCLNNFYYAPIEVEAFGAGVIYKEDGPFNSGIPIIKNLDDIIKLKPPIVENSDCLSKVIKTTTLIKEKIGDKAPIVGVAMSPFSLPVMQMGFDKYIELMYEEPKLFDMLMAINEDFCVNWANAQLKAGATAICYFDPVSSTTIIPKEKYLETGYKIAKRTIAKINGPTATHFASGRCLPIIENVAKTGTAIIGVSMDEDINELKTKAQSCKLSVLGNLNGVQMRKWSTKEAEQKVKEVIKQAGKGGGFILSDNHGEIPWQVPEDVLLAISDAVKKWGHYPLEWIEQ